MKRTNTIFGARNAVFAVAGVMAMLAFSTPAKAALNNPNVFFDYSTLDFVFSRLGVANSVGATIGTFSITQDSGTTLDVILQDGAGAPLDRATVEAGGVFTVSVTGTVTYLGVNSYSITGDVTGTDTTGADKLAASFADLGVSLNFGIFSAAGLISELTAGDGILVGGTPAGSPTSWTFEGTDGETAINNVGGDDNIWLTNPLNFDNGTFLDIKVGSGLSSLDSFFSVSNIVEGADMQINVLPAPPALVLGMIGFATVGWFRRRMS